jgi:hypothetical protein
MRKKYVDGVLFELQTNKLINGLIIAHTGEASSALIGWFSDGSWWTDALRLEAPHNADSSWSTQTRIVSYNENKQERAH